MIFLAAITLFYYVRTRWFRYCRTSYKTAMTVEMVFLSLLVSTLTVTTWGGRSVLSLIVNISASGLGLGHDKVFCKSCSVIDIAMLIFFGL